MECNEVFSISRSTMLGTQGQGQGGHGRPQQPTTSGDFDDVLWNYGPPVGSLLAGVGTDVPAAQSTATTTKKKKMEDDKKKKRKKSKTKTVATTKKKREDDPRLSRLQGECVDDAREANGNAPSTSGCHEPSVDDKDSLISSSVELNISCNAAVLKITDHGAGTGNTGSVITGNDAAAAITNDDDEKPPTTGNGGRHRGWLELCHCRRELFAVKLFYFAFIGALGVVLPYLSVFLKQLGLSAFQIGVISGIRPFLGFLAAPAWGAVADRYSIRRVLMLVSMLAWLAFFGGLYFVGEPRRRAYCPDDMWTAASARAASRVRSRRNDGTTGDGNQQLNLTSSTTAPASNSTATSSADWSTVWNPGSSTSTRSDTSTQPYSSSSADVPSGPSLPSVQSNSTMHGARGAAVDELLREDLYWLYDPTDARRVFVVCLLIICGGELFQAPTTAMSDAATLQILGRERLDEYGAQRAWGPVGWAASSFLIGVILDSHSSQEVVCGVQLKFSDYHQLAYVFIGFFLVSFGAALKINFGTRSAEGQKKEDESRDSDSTPSGDSQQQQQQQQHNTLAIIKVFANVRNGSWILTTFFVGLCNGIIWGFLFWHLDNLGASRVMLGVDMVVVCIFEFAAFFIVGYVIRRVGHMCVMYIGLVGYVVRFVVYACVTNPWMVVPVETLQGVTFSFIWVSLSQYTAVAVPTVSLATVQGIVHGVYFGLGNGVGHLIGGVAIDAYGAVVTFYAAAVVTVVWLLIFVACQKLSKKPVDHFAYQDMNDVTSESPSASDSGR
jgi:MFS family permease